MRGAESLSGEASLTTIESICGSGLCSYGRPICQGGLEERGAGSASSEASLTTIASICGSGLYSYGRLTCKGGLEERGVCGRGEKQGVHEGS